MSCFSSEFEKTYHSLYQIAFHNSLAILQDSHLSKDVAQETLFALWRAYETMNGVGIRSPQAWVKTVARRLSLKAQKHKAKELPCADNIRIRTQNQNDHIRVTELLDAISRLPKPYESVIRYRLQQKTIREIASILGRSERTVNTWVQKSKSLLELHLRTTECGTDQI
ncbi:MAG: RNA polymerase sigma factor [Bacillota bacterium]